MIYPIGKPRPPGEVAPTGDEEGSNKKERNTRFLSFFIIKVGFAYFAYSTVRLSRITLTLI